MSAPRVLRTSSSSAFSSFFGSAALQPSLSWAGDVHCVRQSIVSSLYALPEHACANAPIRKGLLMDKREYRVVR